MFQLQVEPCLRDDVDRISDALEDTGAVSITFTDQYDDAILEPAPGATPLWPHVVIQALYVEALDAELAHQTLEQAFPQFTYTRSTLPDEDWERTCLDQFKPQQFGERLWICPSWLTPPDPTAVNLRLDPGLAFGTGSHATTALCLTWLEQNHLADKDIIDYGCGSGILALAALKLGARHVYAVDIDEQALIATENNALNNQIEGKNLSISTPDSLQTPVNLLIANILLAPLIALKTRFHTLLQNESTLVVSGLLAEQVPGLIEAYQTHFIHQTSMIQGDWALVVFSKLNTLR